MPDEPPSLHVRWPVPDDWGAPFEGAGGLQGKTGWPEVLAEHDTASGRFVWIAECAGEVAGMATSRLWSDELDIEILARNALSRAARGQRVGHLLLEAALDLAWSLALSAVTLESLDDAGLVAFYEGEGFVRDGPPIFDAAWGVLHPMRRPPSFGPP